MRQTDGALRALDGDALPLLGGVDGNGPLRLGRERTTGDDTMLELWEGQFHDNSLDFTRRMTGPSRAQFPQQHAADGNSAANFLQPLTGIFGVDRQLGC